MAEQLVYFSLQTTTLGRLFICARRRAPGWSSSRPPQHWASWLRTVSGTGRVSCHGHVYSRFGHAEDNKGKLVEAGALEALVVCVTDADSDLALQRVAIIGVFDLVYNSGMLCG